MEINVFYNTPMRLSFLPRDRVGFKPLLYILGLPLGIILYVYTRLIRFTVKEDFGPMPNGKRRFALGFHREFPVYLCSKKSWSYSTWENPSGWIGQHSWTGYLTALEIFSTSWVDCMLSTDRNTRPYNKVLKFLVDFESDVFMRTDSGGPYNQVRKTAIRLAIESQRNIICFRQKPTKYFLLADHYFALPFSTLITRWTREISWKELEKLGVEEGTKLVNQEMNNI